MQKPRNQWRHTIWRYFPAGTSAGGDADDLAALAAPLAEGGARVGWQSGGGDAISLAAAELGLGPTSTALGSTGAGGAAISPADSLATAEADSSASRDIRALAAAPPSVTLDMHVSSAASFSPSDRSPPDEPVYLWRGGGGVGVRSVSQPTKISRDQARLMNVYRRS